MRSAIAELPPGRGRLVGLLDSALGDGEEISETWRVWINAYGEAVRLPELRHTIEARLSSWYELIDFALEGLVPPGSPKGLPWSWRFDALLNGFAIQALTSEAALERSQIRDEVIHMLLLAGGGAKGAKGSATRAKRVPVGR
jgi:hypothetical protein